MGCGVICGDSSAQQPKQITTALHIMDDLLPSLNKTSLLVSKQTFVTFIDQYRQDSKRFHLFPKTKLIKDEQIPEQVLLRWKLVLYGQDSDQKGYCSCLGLSQINELEPSSGIIPLQSNIESTVVYHECFSQIEKDLDRTLSLSGSHKREFENVLKRIANFFPTMGYTQGINFVVGFLIICGYSESDAFWMFVHIALNRRFLLLGLYEDGFPLCNVFCILFKNILKRTNQALYSHLFDVIMADVSTWVFKWFITCFVYSFPVQMIKYAWEVMIQLGGLGIVALALSISHYLGPYLLQKQDMCDLSEFLKSLSQIEFFNQYINIEKVIKKVYQIQIAPNDFAGTEETGGFYAVYLRQNCDILQKHLKQVKGLPTFSESSLRCSQKLDDWYNSLLSQRLRFHNTHKTVIQVDIQLPLQSHEKVLQSGEREPNQQEIDPAGVPFEEKGLSYSLSRIQSHDAHRYKISYHFEKINEHLDEDSKSAKSIYSKQHSAKASCSRKSSILDEACDMEELDKLEREVYRKSKQQIKINNYASPALGDSDNKVNNRNEAPQDAPLNNRKKHHNMNMKSINTFTVTGHNILKIDNYDAISVSSKHNSQKERSKITDKLSVQVKGRSCGCKTKTEENKAFDRKSEVASSKGQFSDKDEKYSLSRTISKENISHCEENPDIQSLSLQNVDSYREDLPRAQTNDNYMICSHGPKIRQSQNREPLDEFQPPKEKIDIEVEVLPFKKDKRKRKERISHIDIANGERSFGKKGIIQPSEESLDSVPPFSLDRFSGGNTCKGEGRCQACNGVGCEIQSIR